MEEAIDKCANNLIGRHSKNIISILAKITSEKMRKIIYVSCILLCSVLSAQIIPPTSTKVYFDYDQAGNQIRRYGEEAPPSSSSIMSQEESGKLSSSTNQNFLLSEQEIWDNIRVYPVPVKDILTIDWTEKVNDLISEVSIYEQSTVHWVFQSKKIASLDKKIAINLSQKYMGVYVLTFTLKDGRRISKNITKQ
ncbi:T9SS type A sorting domain-containing protein [uncultured Chryseobacterium sp.]|uniref:T9SS type A sorting domain-containing protein n=1 Tax=uncultured Chryseobacterium sp. TaxID=259322 RepID=UPI0025E8CF50|nr:T9SS type A sorting domain-containing protein [uncultured Chryseobacterium sp.]